MRNIEDLSWREEQDLLEFWDYVDKVEACMIDHCAHKPDDGHLPLPNRIICNAYAAMTFKDYKARVEEDRFYHLAKSEFKHTYKDVAYDWNIVPGAYILDITWHESHEFFNFLFDHTNLRVVEDVLALADEDFAKIKGVGPVRLAKFKSLKTRIEYHLEFLKRFPYFGERGIKRRDSHN